RMEPAAPARDRQKGSRAGRLAWAASIGILIVGGSLAGIWLPDQSLVRDSLLRLAAGQHLAQRPDRSAPVTAVTRVPSATPIEATAAPATAQPTTPSNPATTAVAETTGRSDVPAQATVPAVPVSPTEHEPGKSGPAPAATGVPPATPIEAAAPATPATAQPTTPSNPANTVVAETTGRSDVPTQAAVPAVPVSPTEHEPGKSGPLPAVTHVPP